MQTIRDYAKDRGISYEAVRKQVSRYHEELKDHITKQNKLQFLDDYATDFLDQHRLERTVIVEPSDDETRKEIDHLKNEIDRLRQEAEKRDHTIMELQAKLIQKEEEKNDLIECKIKAELLLEDKAKKEDEIKSKDQELLDTKVKLAEAEQLANSFHKSIFGLYRKD